MVSDGERGEPGQAFGKLHDLDDALGGELTELVPQAQVQLHPVLRAGVLLRTQSGREDMERGRAGGKRGEEVL